jgi:hypothetical protein
MPTKTDAEKIADLIKSLVKKLSEGNGEWGKLSEDLTEDLLDALEKANISFLPKSDTRCSQLGYRGQVDGNNIYLCPGANEAVLLHELVHFAGGQELDAEAIENHLYVVKNSDPSIDDFYKFIKENPCAFMDGKDQLLVSRYVIWNPKSGAMWFQIGTRKSPRKGNKVDASFPAPSTVKDALSKLTIPECSKSMAQKCGAPCKDFDHYGYCDRKVYQPPCYQHRSVGPEY